MAERYYLKPTLCRDIEAYCKLNNIEDINAFANRCATQGFAIVKFGLSPKDNIERETKGIKDIKNESRKKRQEQHGVSGEKKSRKESDTSTVPQGKEEKVKENTVKLETRKEESKPIEEEKEVTVRKIRIIKKK